MLFIGITNTGNVLVLFFHLVQNVPISPSDKLNDSSPRRLGVKDDLLGWERKIEMLLFAAISPTINNLESPSFQSPIVS